MMHEFSFKQKPTVKICGREYEFDPTNNDLLQGVVENYPKILHIAADLQQLLRDLKTGKTDYPSVFEKNQNLLLTCKAFIIGCLGEKEYSEIFSQRRPNNVEHVELCTFLYRTMMQNRENMLMEYLGDENDPVEAADYT